MLKSRLVRQFVGIGLLAVPAAACATAGPLVYSDASPVAHAAESSQFVTASTLQAPARQRVSDHLIVISIDGLRPDAIERFGMTTLQRLMREGSYSLDAQTIYPSVTLPSHTSMLTGVEPRVHGITWNDNKVDVEGRVRVPTILSIARENGLRTAGFFSKGKFDHLLLPGSVDRAVLPKGNGKWLAGRTAAEVEDYLETERPNLMFVHFGDPDYAGHTIGWMGSIYGWAVRRADGAVERVLEAADQAFGPDGYTVIVTADHGGHDRTHGTDAPEDMTIPWITWGKGVIKGTELPRSVHTTDTAATALWLLGLDAPDQYAGVPVQTAFDSWPGQMLPRPLQADGHVARSAR